MKGVTKMTVFEIVYCVLVFIFGSVIGSFLNVVILRTPLKQSLITEPSHCFSCGNRLKWFDMFPIFSWLILRGKCRFCKAKISPRYMIVEAITAVVYTLAYLRFGLSGAWWEFGTALILFPILIVLSCIDIDHFEIPYWCSITVGVIGIAAFFMPFSATFTLDWSERLIALGVVGVLFVVLVLIGGMGGGDLQLMLGASLLLGYKVFPGLFIGIVLGAIYGSVKKFRDHKAEKAASEQIKQVALDWYQEQLDRDVGYVKTGHDDIIVGSITNGQPDIEWEFLDENAWKGIPDKTALSKALRENVTDEKEGGFKIFIKDDLVEKVKYSRHMVFGPFLSVGITTAWLIGDIIVNWYMGLI
ncbi:MAG: prepilin peptidase [Ruminococcaceae bacterium]|nr:prepilin peptidase [Oscillospiraceae bacterium]MBE6902043.1 prepilin peptidase [Oscillospiraceae bacterium]